MSYSLLSKKSNFILTDGQYFLDDFDSKDISVIIKEKSNVELLIKNIKDLNKLQCELKSSSNVKLLLIAKPIELKINILINLEKGSNLSVFFADFSTQNSEIKANINLNEKYSSCIWNLSSLGKNEDNKKIDVSIFHKKANTYSLINNYGVSRNKSKIQFSGVSYIEKGSTLSKAHQNAKILVFDEESDGIAKPILKIDENEIEASHAAVVGKISDDQLFYICSRGLSVNQARQLITYGYLRPIIQGFDDDTKDEINKFMGEHL